MSWSPYPDQRKNPIYGLRAPVMISTSAGKGAMAPRMTLTIRAALIDGVDAWLKPGALVKVEIGAGEHAGMIRIGPNGDRRVNKVALAKPTDGTAALLLPMPPGVAPASRPAAPVRFEYADWLLLTLPAWAHSTAAKPAPAGPTSAERGKELAALAAAEARRRAGL